MKMSQKRTSAIDEYLLGYYGTLRSHGFSKEASCNLVKIAATEAPLQMFDSYDRKEKTKGFLRSVLPYVAAVGVPLVALYAGSAYGRSAERNHYNKTPLEAIPDAARWIWTGKSPSELRALKNNYYE